MSRETRRMKRSRLLSPMITGTPAVQFSFRRSKYFHLLIASIEGFISDNERDRKIVTTIQILLVQNRHKTHD